MGTPAWRNLTIGSSDHGAASSVNKGVDRCSR
jgi:hypothetical protein